MKRGFGGAVWQIKRPRRAFWIGFLGLSVFFGAAAPFIGGKVDPWTFFLTGVVYAALLAFLAVGLGLLPLKMRRRIAVGALIYQVLALLVIVGLVLGVRVRDSLDFLDRILPVLKWIAASAVGIFAALGSFGWFSHHREKRW